MNTGALHKSPVGVAMDVLDEIGDPEAENSMENYAAAWDEVRDYVAYLESCCRERDARFLELLRRLGMEGGT